MEGNIIKIGLDYVVLRDNGGEFYSVPAPKDSATAILLSSIPAGTNVKYQSDGRTHSVNIADADMTLSWRERQ